MGYEGDVSHGITNFFQAQRKLAKNGFWSWALMMEQEFNHVNKAGKTVPE